MAEPEPENTVSQNTPDLKDVFKYGEIELTNRIGQFLTPGSGFRLGVAMGDTRMVNEYKRISLVPTKYNYILWMLISFALS